jgi:hypothetical protein
MLESKAKAARSSRPIQGIEQPWANTKVRIADLPLAKSFDWQHSHLMDYLTNDAKVSWEYGNPEDLNRSGNQP